MYIDGRSRKISFAHSIRLSCQICCYFAQSTELTLPKLVETCSYGWNNISIFSGNDLVPKIQKLFPDPTMIHQIAAYKQYPFLVCLKDENCHIIREHGAIILIQSLLMAHGEQWF